MKKSWTSQIKKIVEEETMGPSTEVEIVQQGGRGGGGGLVGYHVILETAGLLPIKDSIDLPTQARAIVQDTRPSEI